jgi:hypothetical protein
MAEAGAQAVASHAHLPRDRPSRCLSNNAQWGRIRHDAARFARSTALPSRNQESGLGVEQGRGMR